VVSRTRPQFWECFNALPEYIQRIAKEKYRLWERDGFHPSLHFKPLKDDVWPVRINQSHRVLSGEAGSAKSDKHPRKMARPARAGGAKFCEIHEALINRYGMVSVAPWRT
jgi:hypothetical protein